MRNSFPVELLMPITGRTHSFRFTKLGIHLLSLISDVSKENLKRTKIIRRHYPNYMPWYRATSGGGAITLGNRKWNHIYYTENWFSDDKSRYGYVAYGSNLWVWLRMTSHEVIHIAHASRFKFFILYLIIFAYQYLRYGHDQAPLELEANGGTQRLYDFNNYILKEENRSIVDILQSQDTEVEKICIIEDHWSSYRRIA